MITSKWNVHYKENITALHQELVERLNYNRSLLLRVQQEKDQEMKALSPKVETFKKKFLKFIRKTP